MTQTAEPRVLVIEHEADVHLGLIAGRLRAAGADITVVGPHRGRAIPADLSGVDGLIVLGGSMDPVDETGAPWLPTVRDRLIEAVRDQVPTLGVCLGAQLLGMAVGGTARLIPAGPELGLHRIRPTSAAHGDPVLGALPAEGLPALAWHWWEVSDLPAETGSRQITVLAESDACPVQAFRAGDLVWGVQFHLEATADLARGWAAERPDRLLRLGIDPQALTDGIAEAEPSLAASWEPVIDAWIEVARARSKERVGARD
ncbi:MAG: type 1 glutamine amidotransferase [Intrasporangiaceae bacterium]|nr:type 1 glutamine amidotransferase [Intrasporangiaceae bacterium]